MMPPKFDLLLDQFIEEDVRFWVESKHREPEQLELDDFKEWDA